MGSLWCAQREDPSRLWACPLLQAAGPPCRGRSWVLEGRKHMTRDVGDLCPELPVVFGAGSDGVLAWPQQQRLPWPRRAGCGHFAVSHLCPTGATNEAGTAPDPRVSGPPSDSIKEGWPLPREPGSQPRQLEQSQQDSSGPGITGVGLCALSVGSGDRVLTPARLPSTQAHPTCDPVFCSKSLEKSLGRGCCCSVPQADRALSPWGAVRGMAGLARLH